MEKLKTTSTSVPTTEDFTLEDVSSMIEKKETPRRKRKTTTTETTEKE